MNIGPSLNALQNVTADLNKTPSRIFDSFHNPESGDSVEKVMTDMLIGENTFEANAKAIRTLTTVEDIILNELRADK
ncbi:MAG: hypothetical protein GY940_15965 [bacterium]|nr:hypothetical protein [bacterium]